MSPAHTLVNVFLFVPEFEENINKYVPIGWLDMYIRSR